MRKSLLLAMVGILGCCCKGNETPATATTTGKAMAARIPGVEGVDNFAQMNPTLYRGAQPTEDGFKKLKERGVKTVISLRSWHGEKQEVEKAGMTAVEIPLQADVFGSTPPSEADLKKFFDVVLDPAQQPVYFHCAHGKDRTGTMAAVYRMEIDGWTAEEVIEEMQSFGYHDIYKDLINFVKTYKPRGFKKTSQK